MFDLKVSSVELRKDVLKKFYSSKLGNHMLGLSSLKHLIMRFFEVFDNQVSSECVKINLHQLLAYGKKCFLEMPA